MTVNEAIDILQNTSFFGSVMDDIDTAIDMAIRSLEAWEKVKEEITDKSCEYVLVKNGNYIGEIEWNKTFIPFNEALEIIDKHLKETET